MGKIDYVFFNTESFGRYLMIQTATHLLHHLNSLDQNSHKLVFAYTGYLGEYLRVNDEPVEVIDSIRIDNYTNETDKMDHISLHAVGNTCFNLIKPKNDITSAMMINIRCCAAGIDINVGIWTTPGDHDDLLIAHTINTTVYDDELAKDEEVVEWYTSRIRDKINDICDDVYFGKWTNDKTVSMTPMHNDDDDEPCVEREDHDYE